VYADVLGKIQPTRTTVGVDSLPTPISIEMKIIASVHSATMTLIDISPLIDATINVWPGDTPFVRTVNADMRAGANLTLSDIRVSLHVGAHADAPSHYVTDGPDIASR